MGRDICISVVVGSTEAAMQKRIPPDQLRPGGEKETGYFSPFHCKPFWSLSLNQSSRASLKVYLNGNDKIMSPTRHQNVM